MGSISRMESNVAPEESDADGLVTQPMAVHDDLAGVGARLRAARQAAGFTIDELAKMSGLSKGFISKIERDETSPSVRTLVGICHVLDLTVGSLFEQPETNLVRAGEQPIISRVVDGQMQEWLLTPRTLNKVQILLGDLGPGTTTGDTLFSVQCQVEIAHVVSGRLRLRFANEQTVLEAGDTLTFSGSEPHGWENPDPEVPARVVWTMVPAPWSRNNSTQD
jgi:transcriptional regulator with XRE-family HTH domain